MLVPQLGNSPKGRPFAHLYRILTPQLPGPTNLVFHTHHSGLCESGPTESFWETKMRSNQEIWGYPSKKSMCQPLSWEIPRWRWLLALASCYIHVDKKMRQSHCPLQNNISSLVVRYASANWLYHQIVAVIQQSQHQVSLRRCLGELFSDRIKHFVHKQSIFFPVPNLYKFARNGVRAFHVDPGFPAGRSSL